MQEQFPQLKILVFVLGSRNPPFSFKSWSDASTLNPPLRVSFFASNFAILFFDSIIDVYRMVNSLHLYSRSCRNFQH